jgi:hypothetical protein
MSEENGPPFNSTEAIAASDYLRWYYVCTKCGYTSSSTRHDLTICTATFPIQPDWMTPPALPCSGELGDPYTYHWMLVDAGLIGDGDD